MLDFHITHCCGVGAALQRVLGVVENRHRYTDVPRQRVDKAVDWPCTRAGDRHFLAPVEYGRLDHSCASELAVWKCLVIEELQPCAWLLDIDFLKSLVDPLGRKLLALRIGDLLDILAELDLKVAWQV